MSGVDINWDELENIVIFLNKSLQQLNDNYTRINSEIEAIKNENQLESEAYKKAFQILNETNQKYLTIINKCNILIMF